MPRDRDRKLTEADREEFRKEFREMFAIAGRAPGQISIRVELLADLEAVKPPGIQISRILDPFDKPGWVRFEWGPA